MVEEVRASRRIRGAISLTFLVLIRKNKGSLTFDDFGPISLCNTIYKIISKVIVERVKGVFSLFITPKKYGFLKN